MEAKTEGVDIAYKLLLLGQSSVGKTSIILRYIENSFEESNISTCGIDLKCKYVQCDDKKIRLDLWDTAGQERFPSLMKNYFRAAHGFVLVYDITNKESFDKLQGWIKDIKETIEDVNSFKFAVIGNKKDCEKDRQVDYQILKEFAETNNFVFSETSAKTGEGIDKLFDDFVYELLKYRNIGIYKADEASQRRYSKLDKSLFQRNKHDCNC